MDIPGYIEVSVLIIHFYGIQKKGFNYAIFIQVWDISLTLTFPCLSASSPLTPFSLTQPPLLSCHIKYVYPTLGHPVTLCDFQCPSNYLPEEPTEQSVVCVSQIPLSYHVS